MGNSQSSPTKDESRRANRLSKPLTKRLSVPPPEPEPEPDNSSFGSGLIGWQNPWVGHNISSPVEKRGSYPKKAEIPPTLFETESPEESPTEEQALNYNPAIERRRSARPRLMTAGSRRTSYQSEACSQTSPVSEQAPSRASSTRTALQRHNSAVYDNTATSSNTHFLVGNQRFSLMRRRSLLTRPGVATRRASASIRRVPSPIGEPEHQNHDNAASTTLQWPLPLTKRAPSPVRPTSPTDTRYTQLGALKLGSLRVVNASPCPSDRTTLSGTSAPVAGLGLEDLEVAAPNRGATLEIPSLPDLKKSDDLPGSPFSFENSPTITVAPRTKTLFPTYHEDEGILLFDDTRAQLEKSASSAGLARSTSRSLNKSDSGYSSATSVHSMQRSRTQSSAGSQTSVSCGGDSVKSVWVSNGPMHDRSGVEMQRQLNVQSKPENYSRLHLTATRWYDASNEPAPLATTRSRRSTLCAPRYTEYTPRDFTLEVRPSGIEPPYLSQPQQWQQGLTKGPFYGDRLSVALSEGPPSSSSSSATWNSHSSQQTMTGSNERLRKSASEYSMHEGFNHHHSRTKSRSGRVWTKKPGVEAPPLPTILSPGYLQDDLDHELNIEVVNSEYMRGRPRSRSQDYRRRRLSKPRPQADTCI